MEDTPAKTSELSLNFFHFLLRRASLDRMKVFGPLTEMPTARNMGIGESHRLKRYKFNFWVRPSVDYELAGSHGGFPFGLFFGDRRDTEQHSALSEVR